MPLPEDAAGIENVPLEALSGESSSTFRNITVSPRTALEDSEIVSEPQSPRESTANVNPEAPARSLHHSQPNLMKKFEIIQLVVVIVTAFITMTALIPQLKANRLTEESNELTRKGNAIAEAAYNLQKWDDCHDRPDLQRFDICQNVSSLIRKDVVARKLQHDRRALNRTALPSIHLTHTGGSSISNSISTSPKNWIEPGLFSMVVCFLLERVIFRLDRAKRRKKWSAEGQTILPSAGFRMFVYDDIVIFVVVMISFLSTGRVRCRACALTLPISCALFVAVDLQTQQFRKDSTAGQDVEAQDHQREEPDLRTVPAIDKEKSIAYAQQLKPRLKAYSYEEDN